MSRNVSYNNIFIYIYRDSSLEYGDTLSNRTYDICWNRYGDIFVGNYVRRKTRYRVFRHGKRIAVLAEWAASRRECGDKGVVVVSG